MDSLKIATLYTTLATYGYHVGINGLNDQSSEISIFPNPATDYVILNFNEFSKSNNHNYSYCIYDINGRKIKESTLPDSELTDYQINIPLHDLINGIYLLHLTSENYTKMFRFHILR